MSAYDPSLIYQQPYLDMNTEEHSSGSNTPWIIGLVILFLIALGLGIWLLVLYLGGHVGNGSDRLITASNLQITANSNDITGSWGTLSDESDKVTLYVSENPIILNSQGVAIAPTEKPDFKSGSNNSADVKVNGTNRTYNAMLVVTNDDTVNYLVYGPRKVFTQTNTELLPATGATADKLFTINNLTSCNGAVSSSGTYTQTIGNVGLYSLGSVEDPTDTTKSFLLNHGSDTTVADPTDQVLCRFSTGSQFNKVGFGYWINRATAGTTGPIICKTPNPNNVGTTGCTGTGNEQISSISNCQWSYNVDPKTMGGLNKWCLTSLGTTSTTGSTKSPLCLVANSTSLEVENGNTSIDTWYNTFVTTT